MVPGSAVPFGRHAPGCCAENQLILGTADPREARPRRSAAYTPPLGVGFPVHRWGMRIGPKRVTGVAAPAELPGPRHAVSSLPPEPVATPPCPRRAGPAPVRAAGGRSAPDPSRVGPAARLAVPRAR